TANSKTMTGDGTHPVTADRAYLFSDKDYVRGKQMMLSIDVTKTEGTIGGTIRVIIGSTWQMIETINVADISVNTTKRLTLSVTVQDKENRGDVYFQTPDKLLDGSVTLSHVMMVEGTKPTDWSPAPEDMATVTALSKVDQKADSISSTVGTLKTGLDGTNKTVKSQGTQITQNATALTSKADKKIVDSLAGTVSSQGTQITQNAKDITSKADKTTVDDLTKTVSSNSTSITQNAKDIKTKANSSTVNTLAGKMTDAETSISQNANDIKTKADKSTVDTINQTVSDQGTKITQNANDIKSKASSRDVDKLKGTVETNEKLLLKTAQGLTGKADTTQLNKLSEDLTTQSNNFSTTSSGFQASLSKIDDKVNNIQIGGRNLLLDTTNQRNTDYWQTTNP